MVVKNVASRKVIEKCVFKFTDEEFIEHRSKVRPESVIINWYEITR